MHPKIRQYIKMISANDLSLTEIDLMDLNLKDNDIKPLIEMLNKNEAAELRIERVRLQNNNLTFFSTSWFSSAIEIHLDNNKINIVDIRTWIMDGLAKSMCDALLDLKRSLMFGNNFNYDQRKQVASSAREASISMSNKFKLGLEEHHTITPFKLRWMYLNDNPLTMAAELGLLKVRELYQALIIDTNAHAALNAQQPLSSDMLMQHLTLLLENFKNTFIPMQFNQKILLLNSIVGQAKSEMISKIMSFLPDDTPASFVKMNIDILRSCFLNDDRVVLRDFFNSKEGLAMIGEFVASIKKATEIQSLLFNNYNRLVRDADIEANKSNMQIVPYIEPAKKQNSYLK